MYIYIYILHTHTKNPISGLNDDLYFHNITAFYFSKLLRINLEEQRLPTLTKTKKTINKQTEKLVQKRKNVLRDKERILEKKSNNVKE